MNALHIKGYFVVAMVTLLYWQQSRASLLGCAELRAQLFYNLCYSTLYTTTDKTQAFAQTLQKSSSEKQSNCYIRREMHVMHKTLHY